MAQDFTQDQKPLADSKQLAGTKSQVLYLQYFASNIFGFNILAKPQVYRGAPSH
jgi:hypothetical protein